MKEKVYVDRLFADYEETVAINDFKEEITANLTAHVRNLISKGLDEDTAFEKATAELGDITAIADDLGKKRRNEAIGQMYMNAKVPITKRTAVGITAATGLFLIAVGIALFTFLSSIIGIPLYVVSAVLLSTACGLFIYFGLTQETAAHYAMKRKRATAYSVIGFIGVLGPALASVAFFPGESGLVIAGIIKGVFVIPAICALIFLLITEPKRQKPWFKAIIERELESNMQFRKDMVNPKNAARFGMISGGLFMITAAIFITLQFALSIPFAWLILLVYFGVQSMLTSMLFAKK